jgi:hypothetical protein
MRRATAAALCAVLAACAPLENPEASPEPVAFKARPVGRADGNLVAYLSEIRTLGDAALGHEIARQRQLLAKDGGDLARTRLALALSLSPHADDAEVLGLVEPVARRETAAADVRAMASFLHAITSERRRLKESAATANAKLREERKAAEAQKQRADTLQERAAQLQYKLDALTELEKSLSDRPSPNR